MPPLNIRFDGAPNVQGSNIIRLPKLNQGAPYLFGLRVQNEDTTYRSWDSVVEIRWRIKLRPADKHELLVLYLTAGNFTVDGGTDTLNFIVKASDWTDVVLPQSVNHLEMDVPFSFVIEFLDVDGAVVERFAQGNGLISVNLGA